MKVVFFRRLLVVVFVFNFFAVNAQNLVPNPSFEDTIVCAFSQRIDNSPPWMTPPGGLGGGGSPDHFHACWNPDKAATGVGCAGIIGTYYGINGSLREYIQVKLTEPLVAGQCYDVSFKWILQGGPSPHTFGIDCIGMYISTMPLTRDYLSTIPQVRNPVGVPMINFDSWTQLTDTYTATGGEEWITLGNFQDLSVMTLYPIPGQPPPQSTHLAYYLLDDISIVSLDQKIDSLLPDTVKRCSFETYEAILPSGFNYLWSDGTTDNPKTITRSGTYIVTANSECIQDGMDTVVVIIDDRLDLNLPDSVFICEGGDILLQPGGDIDTWLWSDGSTSDSFLITGPGLLWVEATNRCGSLRDSIFVTRILDPVSDLPSDTLFCEGDSLWLTADPSLNPTWEGNTLSDSFLITEAGTYVLEVSNFCDLVTDIIQVYTSSPPVIDNISNDYFCLGDSVQIVPEIVADDWQWFDGSQDSIKWIQQEGWIWIEASTDCGSIRDSIFITEEGLPTSQLKADSMLCEGETWRISIPSDYTVLWNDGSTNNDYVIDDAGRYIVEISSECGMVVDTTDVTFMELPDLEVAVNEVDLCLGDSIVLMASSTNAEVHWDDNATVGPRLLVDEAGIYIVSASNECGTIEEEVEVDVIDCGCQVFIPNSFTPNGDNINDELEVFAACELENIQMRIFSRWGELVFTSGAGSIFWDGTFNGEILLPGVYIYTVSYGVAGTGYVRSGSVTLLK